MSKLQAFKNASLTTEAQDNTQGGRRRRERLLNQYRPEGEEGGLAPLRNWELRELGKRSRQRIQEQYHRRVRRYYNDDSNWS